YTSFGDMHSQSTNVSSRTPPAETSPSDTKLGYPTPRRFVPQSSETTETPKKSWREYLGLSPPQDLIETSPGSTKISQEQLRKRLESGESIESIDAQAGL
ncbi:3430_t:CDS:1, partial [Acaulospora colombiana]